MYKRDFWNVEKPHFFCSDSSNSTNNSNKKVTRLPVKFPDENHSLDTVSNWLYLTIIQNINIWTVMHEQLVYARIKLFLNEAVWSGSKLPCSDQIFVA